MSCRMSIFLHRSQPRSRDGGNSCFSGRGPTRTQQQRSRYVRLATVYYLHVARSTHPPQPAQFDNNMSQKRCPKTYNSWGRFSRSGGSRGHFPSPMSPPKLSLGSTTVLTPYRSLLGWTFHRRSLTARGGRKWRLTVVEYATFDNNSETPIVTPFPSTGRITYGPRE